MSMKRLTIELRGGTASGRRTLEALDLAAALAEFGHEVQLVVRTAALARLASSRGDEELASRLARVAEAGVGPALTDKTDATSQVGALGVQAGDIRGALAQSDAVLAF
jgi:hypothetical protein